MTFNRADKADELPMKVLLIRTHRDTPWGRECLVHWEGPPAIEDTWEPTSTFLKVQSPVWLAYCQQYGLPIILSQPPQPIAAAE